MSLLENLRWKIQRTKRLISDGRYKDLLKSVYANLPPFLNYGKMKDIMKYRYLHRKYKSFIADHVLSRTTHWGGGLT